VRQLWRNKRSDLRQTQTGHASNRGRRKPRIRGCDACSADSSSVCARLNAFKRSKLKFGILRHPVASADRCDCANACPRL
jgi:hypothetical protein